MECSSTVGVNPTPTKFIEHITMSIHMAPDVTSWNSLVDIIEDLIT